MYHNFRTIDEMISKCVEESNALARLSLKDHPSKKSHRQIFSEAYQKGKDRKSLTVSDFNHWRQWIIEEQTTQGHPEIKTRETNSKSTSQLNAFLKRLANTLNVLGKNVDELILVKILADFLYSFLNLHIYPSGNGRMARLLGAYICGWCNHPPLIVKKTEKEELREAQANAYLMRLYAAKKVRESLFDDYGQLMHLTNNNPLNSIYEGQNEHKITVQWQELTREEKLWAQRIPTTISLESINGNEKR